nr:MAG TPA: hypothetical protein [Caudoviricetes sp.]
MITSTLSDIHLCTVFNLDYTPEIFWLIKALFWTF